jgi:hypothetical protein
MKLNEEISRIIEVMGLNENNQSYPYSCAMLYFVGDDIRNLHNQINHEDLYIDGNGFGIESEPHCTLLYGIHDSEVTPNQVQDVLNNRTYNVCKAYNLSLFENPKYDVLKYDMEGDNLHETNQDLKQFPFTSDYPDYHPHMTVAYLKPGKGKEYVNKLGGIYKELKMIPQHVIYSRTDGTKNKMPIRIN